MTIVSYGTDKRLPVCQKCLSEFFALSGKDLFPDVERLELLPIPTGLDGAFVRGTKALSSALGGKGAVTVGYAFPRGMAEELRARGGTVLDVSLDPLFTSENAELTARGALGYLLTTANAAPSDLRIGVVGYGRIGRELVRELLFLGAKVTVFTTKEETRLSLGDVGVDSVRVGEGCPPADFSGVDVLFNTAPAPNIITEEANVRGVRILELASGENLPHGLAYETLHGLPTRMFPESAGRTLCRSVLRLMGGMTA